MKYFFLAILAVAILFVGGGCMSYNGLVKLDEQVDAQWAQVENVYQRRADLVPNLVNTVKGAADFEKSTLQEITEARASVGKVQLGGTPESTADLAKFQSAQNALGSALSRLMVVVERYPDLKATSNFSGLQSQLEGTENRIAVERGRFNDTARTYNTKIKSLPAVFYAAALGFESRPYFDAVPGSDTPPTVDFNASTEADSGN